MINLPSLKEDYLRIQDPTEYRFAVRCYPGGWDGWQTALKSQEFSPMIGQWREELVHKMRSDALARIIDAAQGETRDALGANKYLYEVLAPKNQIGRPSDEKIQQKAKEYFEDEKRREEAYKRILGHAEEEKEV